MFRTLKQALIQVSSFFECISRSGHQQKGIFFSFSARRKRKQSGGNVVRQSYVTDGYAFASRKDAANHAAI